MGKRTKNNAPVGLTHAIYAERANRHSMLRKIERLRLDYRTHIDFRVQGAEQRVLVLQETLTQLQNSHASSVQVTDCRRRLAQAEALVSRLSSVQVRDGFEKKIETLHVFGEVGALVVVSNLVQVQNHAYTVESEQCPNCSETFAFNHVTYMKTCTSCSFTINSIFVTEDVSQDTIVAKRNSRTSSSVTVEPKQVIQMENLQRGDDVANIAPVLCASARVLPESLVARVEQYRRWLQQFLDTAPPTPSEVMELLYRQLSFVHIVSSAKCRPTPVAHILRQHGFKDHAANAVRISREYNGLPVLVIDILMLERMVERFTAMSVLEMNHPHKKKLYTFEFLSALAAWAEGREDLASTVCLQKTRNILKLCDYRIRDILRGVAADPNLQHLDWSALQAMV